MQPGTAGRREMEVKATALPGLEPALDGGTFVRAVIVENEMNIEVLRHLLLHLIEELDKLLAAMARQATADDLAVQDVEGSEKCRGSVPLVVVGLPFRQSRPQWQNGRGPIQRLDLAFFIYAKDESPVGRVEIEANHVPHLLFKPGIVGNL